MRSHYSWVFLPVFFGRGVLFLNGSMKSINYILRSVHRPIGRKVGIFRQLLFLLRDKQSVNCGRYHFDSAFLQIWLQSLQRISKLFSLCFVSHSNSMITVINQYRKVFKMCFYCIFCNTYYKLFLTGFACLELQIFNLFFVNV